MISKIENFYYVTVGNLGMLKNKQINKKWHMDDESQLGKNCDSFYVNHIISNASLLSVNN